MFLKLNTGNPQSLGGEYQFKDQSNHKRQSSKVGLLQPLINIVKLHKDSTARR